MAEMKEAMGSKRSYKKLSHYEVRPIKGENGGHIVTNHYHADGMTMPKGEEHMFGKDGYSDGGVHIADHMKLPAKGEEAASEPPTGEEAEA